MNVSFFFVKPHAFTDDVVALAERHLTSRGIRTVSSGALSAAASGACIDAHYGQLADRAMHIAPGDLPLVSEKARASFLENFGLSWDDALAAGTLGAWVRGCVGVWVG